MTKRTKKSAPFIPLRFAEKDRSSLLLSGEACYLKGVAHAEIAEDLDIVADLLVGGSAVRTIEYMARRPCDAAGISADQSKPDPAWREGVAAWRDVDLSMVERHLGRQLSLSEVSIYSPTSGPAFVEQRHCVVTMAAELTVHHFEQHGSFARSDAEQEVEWLRQLLLNLRNLHRKQSEFLCEGRASTPVGRRIGSGRKAAAEAHKAKRSRSRYDYAEIERRMADRKPGPRGEQGALREIVRELKIVRQGASEDKVAEAARTIASGLRRRRARATNSGI